MNRIPRIALAAALLLAAAGTAARLAALGTADRTVASVTEDGYLMLTVARNLALGLGLTTSAGEIPTNGVQPAATALWAGLHWIVGGERLPALRAVVLVEWLMAIGAAAGTRAVARRWLAAHPHGEALAWLAAALWYAGPMTLRHTTNGLETGLLALTVVAVLQLERRCPVDRPSIGSSLGLGLALGAAFLVRNDAVFLVASMLFVRLVAAPSAIGWPIRLAHAGVVGLASLAAASPWLARNLVVFGHLVPISGRAQSLDSPVGLNLATLPRVLAEYAFVVAPWPDLASRSMPALALAAALAGAVFATVRCHRLLRWQADRSLAILLLFGAGLAAYYGLFFGASYFLSRYLFPLSIAGAVAACAWWAALTGWNRAAGLALGAVGLATALTAGVRFVDRAGSQPHLHVVRWVESHVPPDVWVAAPQSGTLGYYHDRTVNLDGKVNPEALAARRERRLFDYLAADVRIRYVADWYGLARWVDRPEAVSEEGDPAVLVRHFEVAAREPAANLLVLRRRADPAAGGR